MVIYFLCGIEEIGVVPFKEIYVITYFLARERIDLSARICL